MWSCGAQIYQHALAQHQQKDAMGLPRSAETLDAPPGRGNSDSDEAEMAPVEVAEAEESENPNP